VRAPSLQDADGAVGVIFAFSGVVFDGSWRATVNAGGSLSGTC